MNKVDCIDDDDLRPEYPDWQILGGVRGARFSRKLVDHLTVRIEVAQLPDGRWRARSSEFSDAFGHGADADSALNQCEDLISQIIDDRVARGEIPPTGLNFAIDYR
jgi:predicted RNase H-like HicB family nuclease